MTEEMQNCCVQQQRASW